MSSEASVRLRRSNPTGSHITKKHHSPKETQSLPSMNPKCEAKMSGTRSAPPAQPGCQIQFAQAARQARKLLGAMLSPIP